MNIIFPAVLAIAAVVYVFNIGWIVFWAIIGEDDEKNRKY